MSAMRQAHGGAQPDQHYLSERDRLMSEIEATEQERVRLERENAKAQAELNISDEQLETLLARVDFKLIQQQIMDLMKQKSELEAAAEDTQQKIKSAQAEETYAVAKHQELVQSFQQLKTALDYGNAEAKAKVDTLQAQYDEQKRALERLQVQEEAEYKKKTAEMAKKLAPECKKRIQRAVVEERKKTKQQLILLEKKAQLKFEAAAKITCDKYAQECKNTVNMLMDKKREQEKTAEKLLRDINAAKDVLLKNLRDNAESFEDEKLLGERDDALDAHLDTLKTECHRLWEKLDIEPERIIAFLEKVVEVSPKCRGFYHFLYNEARHLISTLLIKEAITHREAVRKIANVAKYKTLEMRQTLETTLSDVKQVDTYVSLQIFPHVQHQFQILVEDVDKISKTIMGYLQEYQLAFGRTYLHEGTPYIERILKDRAEFSTALRKVMFPLQLPEQEDSRNTGSSGGRRAF